MKCNFCNNDEIIALFKGKFPIYPLNVPKEVKLELDSKYKEIIELEYFFCEKCGLFFSSLNSKELDFIKEMYQKFYTHISRYELIDFEVDSFLEFIEKHVENCQDILEIGCFNGYVLSRIKNRDIKVNVLGIDPSERGIKEAKKHEIPSICDFFPSPKVNTNFDLIFSRHVIEHVDNPIEFLKSQMLYLKENGIIVFETPNVDWCILNKESICFHPQHLNLLSKAFIKTILVKLGFKYYEMVELTYRIIIAVSNVKHSGMKEIEKMTTDSSELMSKILTFRKVYDERIEKITNLLNNCVSIAIWGAGSFTGYILALMNEETLNLIELIVDSDLKKFSNEYVFFNKSINSPLILKEKKIGNLIIMSQFYEEILQSIKNLDLDYSFNIFTLIQGISHYFYDSSSKSIKKID